MPQVPNISKRLTCPSAYLSGVMPSSASRIRASHVIMLVHSRSNQAPRTSKCLFAQCLIPPSISHNHAYSFGVMPPSACSFSVSHQVRHTFKRHTCPSVSHIQMHIHSVSCLRLPHASERITYPSVSHLQASHIIMPIHSVPDIRAPHISKCLFVQCHVPKCLAHPSVSHIHVHHHDTHCDTFATRCQS